MKWAQTATFLAAVSSALGSDTKESISISISIEGPVPVAAQLAQLEDMRARGTLDENNFFAAVHETVVVGPLVSSLAVLSALHSKGQLADDEFITAKSAVIARHTASISLPRRSTPVCEHTNRFDEVLRTLIFHKWLPGRGQGSCSSRCGGRNQYTGRPPPVWPDH